MVGMSEVCSSRSPENDSIVHMYEVADVRPFEGYHTR